MISIDMMVPVSRGFVCDSVGALVCVDCVCAKVMPSSNDNGGGGACANVAVHVGKGGCGIHVLLTAHALGALQDVRRYTAQSPTLVFLVL